MELTTKRGGDEKLTKPSSATKGDEALRSAMEIQIRNRRSPEINISKQDGVVPL